MHWLHIFPLPPSGGVGGEGMEEGVGPGVRAGVGGAGSSLAPAIIVKYTASGLERRGELHSMKGNQKIAMLRLTPSSRSE